MDEHSSDKSSPIYDRAFLLHGSRFDEVLTIAEIERYGLDGFADPDYVSVYGMRENGIATACVFSAAQRLSAPETCSPIGSVFDIASVATRIPPSKFAVIDPFAGSCNTLFWILRHLPNSEGIAFESDIRVFELTHRSLAVLQHRIELVHGDSARLLEELLVEEDRGIVAFIATPWGTALDEV